jgi:hypothetical protein
MHWAGNNHTTNGSTRQCDLDVIASLTFGRELLRRSYPVTLCDGCDASLAPAHDNSAQRRLEAAPANQQPLCATHDPRPTICCLCSRLLLLHTMGSGLHGMNTSSVEFVCKRAVASRDGP